MASSAYTRNEIAFMLSLDHGQALDYAAGLRDSIGQLTEDDGGRSVGAGETPPPFIAMWAEINQAAKRIRTHKEDLALTQLRLQGYTDEEVAGMLGLGRRTVGRRWRATLQEILEQLGGESEGPIFALDHIDLCLACGRNPRTRTTRRTRVFLNRKWRWKRIERPSSMCASCLEPAEESELAMAA